jgi:hypothetical protein
VSILEIGASQIYTITIAHLGHIILSVAADGVKPCRNQTKEAFVKKSSLEQELTNLVFLEAKNG